MTFFRHQGDRLVHDPARHADIFILSALRRSCKGLQVVAEFEEIIEGESDRTFQSSGRGKPCAEWDLTINIDIQSRSHSKGPDRASDVVAPIMAAVSRIKCRYLKGYLARLLIGSDPNLTVISRGYSYRGPFSDREGKDPTVAVVDMFTDEIDPTGT